MSHRFAIAIVLAAALSFVAAGQNWAPPRTPDGYPDLQGIWTNSTLTPMERPRELGTKKVFTEEEAKSWENRDLTQGSRDRRDGSAEEDVGRAYNELFFERGTKLARYGGMIRTSLITDPADGRIPALTPEAEKRLEAARAYAALHPADTPRDRSLTERCLHWQASGPPMLPGPYNNDYQIVQTPGYVMILVEMVHDVRVIPTDGRPHLPPTVREWIGDSVGRWEGNTLVVDTTNFTGKTRFRGSSENLHVVERFTRVAPDSILYAFTIDDPSTYTKPWSGELPLVASLGPIYEYACHEGNVALMGILAGARADEKKAEAGGKSR
jgi:hypothetical protein